MEPSIRLRIAFAASNGPDIERLFNGDISDYASQSEADLGLCGYLAFYSGGSREALDVMFRSSKLLRDKWDKKHHSDGRTYGEGTIDKALESQTEFYEFSAEEVANAEAEAEAEANSENTENSDQQPWESPAPFYEYELPAFPTEVLPSWIRAYVEQLTEEAQTPIDLAAMQALSACATCVARNVEIEARNGWREPLNIWTLTVLDSANRKSKVVSDVVRPLEVLERDLMVAIREPIARAINERKILEERLSKAQKDCAKLDGDELARRKDEANALAVELGDHKIPVVPRLFVDDTTTEALGSLICEQKGRLGMFGAEGGVFETMAGRYSNGAPNIDAYLKSHAGDSLRVGRSQRSERVERPALTIGLAVQADVLRGLATKPGFRCRGLLGRFLYALPPSKLGRRKAKAAPVNSEARRTYEQNLIRMANIQPADAEADAPVVLTLTQDADDYLAVFQDEIEPKLAEGGELAGLSDWAGKLCGAILRIAGNLHIADRAARLPVLSLTVDVGTLKRAIIIGRFLIPHAQAGYAEMGADPLVEDARYVLRWLGRERSEKVTRRDIHQGNKGRFKKVTEIDPVLELLIQHGYLRVLAGTGETRRGRKSSPIYEVNPHVGASQNSQYSQNSAAKGNSENTENSEKGVDVPEFGEDVEDI